MVRSWCFNLVRRITRWLPLVLYLGVVEASFGATAVDVLNALWAKQKCPQQIAARGGDGAAHDQVVVVVDPVSSAYGFGMELRRRGFSHLVSLLSRADLSPSLMRTYRRGDFAQEIVLNGGNGKGSTARKTEEALLRLNGGRVAAILAGAESSVLLSHSLSLAKGVRTIGEGDAHRWRDKYIMGEMVRAAGFDAVKQKLVSTWDDMVQWQTEHGQWPVVVKPRNAASSNGVSACGSWEELRRAFDKLKREPNSHGYANDTILIQEFLDGVEYVLDVVARDGVYVVSDMWKYNKFEQRRADGIHFLYSYDEMIAFEGEIQQQLIQYGFSVMRALGIVNGPVHAEIKMTSRGPVLVELAVRVPGDHLPQAATYVLGRGQIELAVAAQFFPSEFVLEVDQPYQFSGHVWNVNLKAHGGRLKPGFVAQIEALEAYVWHHFTVEEGQPLPVTDDLSSSPGTVLLRHADLAVIQRCYERIRQLEGIHYVD